MRSRLALLPLLLGLVAPIGQGVAVAAAPASPVPAAASPPGPALVVSHGSRAAKTVALTFDDGHGNTDCRALVDALVATQTPATFFPSVRWAGDNPELWQRIAALGFPVANHTATHANLTGLAYAAQLDEITRNQAAMEAEMHAPMLRLFRPPFGAYNGTTLRAAAAAGYRYVVLWDTTFADSSRRPNGGLWPLTSYIRSAEKGTNGSIILGHCGDPVDPQIIVQVVADYRARGFTFVTLPQMLGMPGAQAMTFAPASPSPDATAAGSPGATPATAPPSSGGVSASPDSAPSSIPSSAASAGPPASAATASPVTSPPASSPPASGSPTPASSEQGSASAIGLALVVLVLLVLMIGIALVGRSRRSHDT